MINIHPNLITAFRSRLTKASALFPENVSDSLVRYVLSKVAVAETYSKNDQMMELIDLLFGWAKRSSLSDEEVKPIIGQFVKTMKPVLDRTIQEDISTKLERKYPQKMPGRGTPATSPTTMTEMDIEEVPPSGKMANMLKEIPNKLLSLADAADNAGLTRETDKLAEVLPRLGLLKLAQYEGAQHYWMMNGRAFEKAWREKRKKKRTDDTAYHGDDPDHYKSANECWWETLEEYQKSLMGNHEEWLKKYASKPKKKDKETEKAMDGIGPSSTMSWAMQEKHREMEGEGKTPGEGVVKWLNEQNKKLAGLELTEKIARRIENGYSPGPAFYRSMDDMISGKYQIDLVRAIRTPVEAIKKAAINKGNIDLEKLADDNLVALADLGQNLKDLWTGVKGYTGWGGGHGGKWQTGPMVALVQEMRKHHPDVARFLNAVKTHGTPKDVFYKTLRPILEPYNKFLFEANKRGWDLSKYPDLKQLLVGKDPIDPATIQQFTQNFDTIMTDIGEDLALAVQKSKEKAVRPGETGQEDPEVQQATEVTPEMEATPEKEGPQQGRLEISETGVPTLPFGEEAVGQKPTYEVLQTQNQNLQKRVEELEGMVRQYMGVQPRQPRREQIVPQRGQESAGQPQAERPKWTPAPAKR